MARQRKHADRRMSNLEIQHEFQDRASMIDFEMNEAFGNINWERRNKASKTLVDFITAYFVGLMIDNPPSEKFVEALGEMEFALQQSRPYNIELPRGTGKTSAVEMAVLWLLATGKRKFCVIVSNNSRAAGNILKDIGIPVLEKETAFAQDFPELCLPFQLCNGSFRRRQLYNGRSTDIEKNAGVLRFATLYKDGKELPTSGSVVTVRGITSGIRGLKVGKLRPDTVILDDLQSSEIASSPEQVQKIQDIIRKDIMNLSSKGKLAVLMTSTPLMPEDLCEKIENDIAWKTTKYPAIIKWPDDIVKDKENGLWAKYFKLYDSELADDMTHYGSLEFYKLNKEMMDKGAVLFAPDRYKIEDGHISGLQALLEKRHMIGDVAFSAEMQMKPHKFSFRLDIKPKDILSKMTDSRQLEVPDGYVFIAASTDLNLSYALTTVIVGFKPDMSAHVITYFFTKCNIDSKLPTAEYNEAVYDKLAMLGKEIKALNLKIDGWGIDASGVPFDAVTLFAKNSMKLVGIPACAMMGRASHIFNPYVRTRLRDAINKTVLCGDAQEHVKAGAGKKYVFWDSDFYRETTQKAFLAKVGMAGSCTLFKDKPEAHSEYAIQVCNERLLLIQHKKDGKDYYSWKSREPHDALDATAQAFAVAASQGISGLNSRNVSRSQTPIKRRIHKPKIKLI